MRTMLASLLAVGLGGCISINLGDPEPYALDLPGKQLRDVSPPETLNMLVARVAVPADAAAAAVSVVEEPARTDVRGAGDGSAKVEDRVVITAGKEIEHRQPDFSREQIASWVCRAQGGQGDGLNKALDAWKATVAAHDANVAYEQGTLSRKLADEAEKKRQDAIGNYRGMSDMLFGMFGGRSKKNDLPTPVAGALSLENIDLFTFTENGKEVMAISGVVRNTGKAAAIVPPVTLQALDRWEFLLAGQTTLLPMETLAPGASQPFEIRFINPPDTTAEVYAHFAPPFEYRVMRDCANFDPRTAKAGTAKASLTASGPAHSPAELNELVRIYRYQAEGAWQCRLGKDSKFEGNGGLRFGTDGSGERRDSFSISLGAPDMGKRCDGAEQMMGWRDLFVMAEAADEAWGASRALEEAQQRNDAAETSAAEAAQRVAMDRVQQVATLALARAGGSAPGVAVELSRSTLGFDKGRYVEIAGVVRNTSDAPREVDALMLAMVDRLDLPLMTVAIDNPVTLGPGESATFTHRVKLRDEPVKRKNDATTMPTWQIRVGAMKR